MIQDALLATADLQQLHDHAVRLLDEIGFRTAHQRMRDLLAGKGCRLAGERIHVPPRLIEDVLNRAPRSFSLYGRSVEDEVVIGTERILGCNAGIFPRIYDIETGKIRASTLKDVEDTARVLDAMDNVHVLFGTYVDATDVRPGKALASCLAAVLANTTKPLVGPGVVNHSEAEAVVALARAVREGDAAAARERPVCAPFICPISPLGFPDEIVDALVTVAEAGLPYCIVTNPVVGLTAPFTLASAIVMGHAEVLASAVMADAVAPGLPMINQNTPTVAEMKTLISASGGPETALIRQTVSLLYRHLGLPVYANAHTCSARLDWQAGEEKALNALTIASGRPSILGGIGALANATLASYEAILLDNERFSAIRRIMEGLRVDEDHLAYEMIKEGLNRGDFLACEHTVRHMRSGEVWQPRLATRMGLVDGRPEPESSLDRARAEAKRLLADYRPAPLPKRVQAEFARIVG